VDHNHGTRNGVFGEELNMRFGESFKSSKGLQGDKLQVGLSQERQWADKAKLIAKGYSQKEGIHYNEIFSPVVKHTSIRLLLAIVTQCDLGLEKLNVRTFLHGELEEKIYIKQSEKYFQESQENKVCLLKKSIYRVKQSPRQWYKRFDLFMINANCQQHPMWIWQLCLFQIMQ